MPDLAANLDNIIFYLFASLAVIGAVLLVAFRNPVSSALSMVLSFVGLAGIFVSLNAYFVGIIQILVYAGAIMVLFLFIIMLLDIKAETKQAMKPAALCAAILIPALFVIQLVAVLNTGENKTSEPLALEAAASNYAEGSKINEQLTANRLPDVHLIGHTLFGKNAAGEPYRGYNFPLQMAGVILLVASIGVVTLSARKSNKA